MSKSIVFLLMVSMHSYSFALNTFVGNGGSAGDIERLITEKQLLQSLKSLSSHEVTENYCVCNAVFKDHSECTPLNSLNEKQQAYCSSALRKSGAHVVRLLESQSVRFNWTRGNVYVRDDGQMITADAVADPNTRTITINQNRFLSLPATKRLFLLAHEAFHLVPIEKNLIGDSGEVGPFKGKQGTRKLLNAMASGAVMRASSTGAFRKYRRALKRRKAG